MFSRAEESRVTEGATIEALKSAMIQIRDATNAGRSQAVKDFIDLTLAQYTWFQPEDPPSIPRSPKDGDEVWFYDAESQWWMTGQMVGLPSNGRAKVSPTAWPGSMTMPETPKVKFPDRRSKRWISEKIRDLANQMRDLGDVNTYRELLMKSVEVDRTNPHPLDNLGIYWTGRDVDKTDEFFARSIEVEPRWWHSYSNWGIMFRERGDLERARQMFEEAFVRNPLHISILDNLGHWNLRNDDLKTACVYYWIIREIESSRKMHIQHLDRVLQRCDSIEKNEL